MTRIRWRDVPEPDVEQMVAVLLSHQHQGAAARINGRGGDGGRDVQITTPSGIRAFEIKSFTGIDDPFEPPQAPELAVDASRGNVADEVKRILALPIADGLL